MTKSKEPCFTLRVPFRDVDMHGHVHNAVYLSYCETAVTEFIRKNDLRSSFSFDEENIVYYVRKTELLFNRPSRFEEELFFVVRISRLGGTSITFGISVLGAGENASRATAAIVWVCVDTTRYRPQPLPEATRAALSIFIDEKAET